jgi:hypothetical protein
VRPTFSEAFSNVPVSSLICFLLNDYCNNKGFSQKMAFPQGEVYLCFDEAGKHSLSFGQRQV